MNKLDELTGGSSPAFPLSTTLLGSSLCLKMSLAQGLSNIAAQRFWSHPNLPACLPAFLRELYSLVSCSVPLMNAAYQRATELAPADPLAARTAEYLKQHIEEELHHDEWLLDDLVACGMNRDELLRLAPSANIARLVGSQYCWIFHAHPAALFGYLGVIEGNPPLPEHIEEIRLRTGFPAEAFRCMHLHAADDVEHLKELTSTISKLPLTKADAELISMSGFATLEGIVDLLQSLMESEEQLRDEQEVVFG